MERKYWRQKNQVFCLVLLAVFIGKDIKRWTVNAVFDEAKAVHIVSDSIDNATLIIGTHLIYLGSITDEIYAAAEETEAESNQYNRYYKSELAGGRWYNITDASSLEEISTAGIPVTKEEIEALYVTHHTKADGKTYDLRTGNAVCIYNISDPYSLTTMKELEPLIQQYKNLQEKINPGKTDKKNQARLKALLEKQLNNEKTEECNQGILALQQYLDILMEAGADTSQIAIVQEVMKALDAKRRTEIFLILAEIELEQLIKEIEEEEQVDYSLLSAIGDSIAKVEESLTKQRAKILTEGTTLLNKVQYQFSMSLMDQAKKRDYSGCDKSTDFLLALSRIEESRIVEAGKEKELLEKTLIPEIDQRYLTIISTGANDKYQAAVASHSARAVLNQILKEQKNQVEVVRSEMQFLLQAKINRITKEEAEVFIKSRLSQIDGLKQAVKQDEFSIYVEESIEAYQKWLKEKLQEIDSVAGTNEMERLLKEKEELLTKKLKELDYNNLHNAKKLDVLIAEKDREIAEKAGEDKELQEMAQQTAEAVYELRDSVIQSLQKGDYKEVNMAIEGLDAWMQINSSAALKAMEDIYRELTKQAYLKEEQDALEAMEAIEASIEKYAGQLGNIGAEKIQQIIEQELGGSFDKLDEMDQAAFILTIETIAKEKQDSDLFHYVLSMAEQAAEEKNPYFYLKLKKEPGVYISIECLAKCMGYRYLFNDNKKQGILQKGSNYYIFQAFGTEVGKAGKSIDYMEKAAGYQMGIYIPAEYALDTFQCEAKYLKDSLYGVVMDRFVKEKRDMLLEALYNSLGQ